MSDSKIIAALASYGMSGQVFHAPFLEQHPGFQLDFILERSKNLSKQRYPDAVIVRHFDDIINNKDIDLVVINTPDDLHFQMARKALTAGKHVVVEKPFTRSLAEAEELIELAEKNSLILAVYQNRRWDSDFLTVQKVLENGWLGKLVEFESHFDRYRPALKDDWKDQGKAGTGSIYNLGAHLIDQALVLFGKPKALWADIRKSRPGAAVDDDYEVKMIYPDVRVTLKSSYLVREKGPRFILHGTKGSFVKHGLDVQEDWLKRGEMPQMEKWGDDPESNWGLLNSEIEGIHYRGQIESVPGDYMAFYRNVYDAVKNNMPLAVQPHQAATVIDIIEKALRSSEKEEVVYL